MNNLVFTSSPITWHNRFYRTWELCNTQSWWKKQLRGRLTRTTGRRISSRWLCWWPEDRDGCWSPVLRHLQIVSKCTWSIWWRNKTEIIKNVTLQYMFWSPWKYLLQEPDILRHQQSPAHVQKLPGEEDVEQDDAQDAVDKVEEQTENVAKCIFL